MRKLPLFEASATMIGTVIGAGILGIPYAMAQVGLPLGVAMMIVLGLAILARHTMMAEVTLRTSQFHQLPGYAGLYLGSWARRVTFVATFLSGFGVLLAYMVGQGEILAALLGGSSFVWSLAFFFLVALFILAGLTLIKHSELVMTSLILLITLVIGFFAWHSIGVQNLVYFEPGNWILPYGVLLFALSASVAIPQMREELVGRERYLRRAILLGSIVVFLVYFLFSFLVLGVTGAGTTEIATVGLGQSVGPEMVIIGNLLAFFTIGTSFLTIGLGMKEMLQFDFKLKPIHAWWLTVLIPLALFSLGLRDFISILGVVGGVLIGIQSIIIVMTFWRARKEGQRQPEFTLGPMRVMGSLLILIFVFGAIFTLINA